MPNELKINVTTLPVDMKHHEEILQQLKDQNHWLAKQEFEIDLDIFDIHLIITSIDTNNGTYINLILSQWSFTPLQKLFLQKALPKVKCMNISTCYNATAVLVFFARECSFAPNCEKCTQNHGEIMRKIALISSISIQLNYHVNACILWCWLL